MRALAMGLHIIVEPVKVDGKGLPSSAARHYRIDSAVFVRHHETITGDA
jgi:hypothetical protein